MHKKRWMIFVVLLIMMQFQVVVGASSLNKTKLTLYVGDSYKLKLSKAKKISWSSTNRKIATVSSGGLVKAKKAGTVTIKAKAAKKTYSCKVTVKKAPALSASQLTLAVGQSATLKMENTTAQVTWSSSDPSIATVSSKGVVKAAMKGSCTITAVCGKKYQCQVTVTDATDGKLKNTEEILSIGQSVTLSLDRSTATAEWSSADTSVATVSADGTVKAVNTGVTTITAVSLNTTSTCRIIVKSASKDNRIRDLTGNKKERLLIAHMGYSRKYPENTIPAFEAAGKDSRYFAIETDLHDTKDGKIVCMHGFKVEERTDGTGRISDLTLDEIRALTITYGNGLSNYAETPLQIPTFEEYLAICKQYHKIAFVEIKALAKQSNLKVIYETLKAYDMLDRCILTSGKTSQLETFREKYDSDIPIAPLLSADMTDAKLTKWSRMDDVMIYLEHPKVTKDDVRIARLLNLEYGSYTLSTSSLIQKLLSYDVYMLCVNRPDL